MVVRTTARQQAEIERRIKELERKLAPDVARIRYTFTEDSVGDESIFFRIVLSNAAARESRLDAAHRPHRKRTQAGDTVRRLWPSLVLFLSKPVRASRHEGTSLVLTDGLL